MAYTKFYDPWHNAETALGGGDISTPLTAAAMDHIEAGIEAAAASADAIAALLGLELAHEASSTSGYSVTATNASAAHSWITLPELTFDGDTWVWLEAFAPAIFAATAGQMEVVLADAGVHFSYPQEIGWATGAHLFPHTLFFKHRLKPSAGAHTYGVELFLTNGATQVTVYGGVGTGEDYSPAYFRCERIPKL